MHCKVAPPDPEPEVLTICKNLGTDKGGDSLAAGASSPERRWWQEVPGRAFGRLIGDACWSARGNLDHVILKKIKMKCSAPLKVTGGPAIV